MQGDPVKEFREGIGRDCDKMKEMARVSKTGKGIDGRPLDPKTLQDYIPFVNAVIAACANPTVDTVRGVVEISFVRHQDLQGFRLLLENATFHQPRRAAFKRSRVFQIL